MSYKYEERLVRKASTDLSSMKTSMEKLIIFKALEWKSVPKLLNIRMGL
jgi:hypothetical protein